MQTWETVRQEVTANQEFMLYLEIAGEATKVLKTLDVNLKKCSNI